MGTMNADRCDRPILDPQERHWLERKALHIARELGCTLPEALVAARAEFEQLRARPKAIVIPLVGRARRGFRAPHEASN
ncbi:MAG TPA: hypothetical protein VLD39_00690 [Gammaproteobacteria bacterium]|nr:hypothetical protein [Gammaproteobacteria bacterium]